MLRQARTRPAQSLIDELNGPIGFMAELGRARASPASQPGLFAFYAVNCRYSISLPCPIPPPIASYIKVCSVLPFYRFNSLKNCTLCLFLNWGIQSPAKTMLTIGVSCRLGGTLAHPGLKNSPPFCLSSKFLGCYKTEAPLQLRQVNKPPSSVSFINQNTAQSPAD